MQLCWALANFFPNFVERSFAWWMTLSIKTTIPPFQSLNIDSKRGLAMEFKKEVDQDQEPAFYFCVEKLLYLFFQEMFCLSIQNVLLHMQHKLLHLSYTVMLACGACYNRDSKANSIYGGEGCYWSVVGIGRFLNIDRVICLDNKMLECGILWYTVRVYVLGSSWCTPYWCHEKNIRCVSEDDQFLHKLSTAK